MRYVLILGKTLFALFGFSVIGWCLLLGILQLLACNAVMDHNIRLSRDLQRLEIEGKATAQSYDYVKRHTMECSQIKLPLFPWEDFNPFPERKPD